jgi:hypothetical protein
MGSMHARAAGVTVRLKQRGSPTENYWTGRGRDALEVAYTYFRMTIADEASVTQLTTML